MSFASLSVFGFQKSLTLVRRSVILAVGSKIMRDLIFIIVTMILVWLAVYFAIPGLGYSPQLWAIITCASISAILSGLIVLLRESVIEDIVKVVFIVVLLLSAHFNFDFS